MIYNKASSESHTLKDTSNDEIRLCAQNIDTIIGTIVNTVASACVIVTQDLALTWYAFLND